MYLPCKVSPRIAVPKYDVNKGRYDKGSLDGSHGVTESLQGSN